jgi:hypothetical protein
LHWCLLKRLACNSLLVGVSFSVVILAS